MSSGHLKMRLRLPPFLLPHHRCYRSLMFSIRHKTRPSISLNRFSIFLHYISSRLSTWRFINRNRWKRATTGALRLNQRYVHIAWVCCFGGCVYSYFASALRARASYRESTWPRRLVGVWWSGDPPFFSYLSTSLLCLFLSGFSSVFC